MPAGRPRKSARDKHVAKSIYPPAKLWDRVEDSAEKVGIPPARHAVELMEKGLKSK